jgi:hypothetical protein
MKNPLRFVDDFEGKTDRTGRTDQFALLAIIAFAFAVVADYFVNNRKTTMNTDTDTQAAIGTFRPIEDRHFFNVSFHIKPDSTSLSELNM